MRARSGLSDSVARMNVRERAVIGSPLIMWGPGPSTSRSSPSIVVNHFSSPGFAGSDGSYRAKGPNASRPISPPPWWGVLATMTRQRWSGSIERFQPMMKRYCDFEKVRAFIEKDQVVRIALESSACRIPARIPLYQSAAHRAAIAAAGHCSRCRGLEFLRCGV